MMRGSSPTKKNPTPVKRTPTPTSFRSRLLQNCIDAIRSKRNNHVQLLRLGDRSSGRMDTTIADDGLFSLEGGSYDSADKLVSRQQLMENFVAGIYNETLNEDDSIMMGESRQVQSDLLGQLDVDQYNELMTELYDAIELELRELEGISNALYEEEQLMAEQVGFEQLQLYDEPNVIICPICRISHMTIDEEVHHATCLDCGASIRLEDSCCPVDGNDTIMVDDRPRPLPGISCHVSADEFKNRLATAYDK